MLRRNFVRWATLSLVATASGAIAIAQGPPQGGSGPSADDQARDFHFRDEDRSRFQAQYHTDIEHWRSHPQNRPMVTRGQTMPASYRPRPVPRSISNGMPPPPPGFQYAYYRGYIVAYNPRTRMVADVLDLVVSSR